MTTEIFKISGMTCQGCVKGVRSALEKVPGISVGDIRLENGEAEITFDEQSGARQAIETAIENAGFEVEPAR